MFFQSLSLQNFGPFESAEFVFRPGVNVIVGENGSGKSQLVGAIIAALIGRPALRINKDGTGPSRVDVIIREEDVVENLNLSVSLNQRGDAKVEQRPEAGERSPGALSLRLLAAWSSSTAPRLLLSEAAMRAQLPDLHGVDFEAAMPDALKRSHEWLRLRASGIMNGAGASAGEIAVGVLLHEFARRIQSRESLPLILDGYLERLADEHVALCVKVLEFIGETSQVILVANRQPPFSMENTIHVGPRITDVRSLIYYNYLIEEQRPRLKPRPQPKWVRGQTFSLPESRTCELKEVRGNNPVAAIASLVDQYVVAFLNAGHPQEGTILWGIRDEDRKITGVTLSDQECDELRRIVTDKLHQIMPPVAPTAYRIELHRVSDKAQVVPNLYVIEVRVPAARRTLLFSTGTRDVYVKTDAGKRRLSALEIQYELLKRLGIDVPF